MCVAPPLIMPSTEASTPRTARLPRTHPNPARRAARSSAGTARMYRRPDRCPSAAPTEPYRTGVVLINYLRAVFDPFRLDGEVPLIQAARSLPRHVGLLEKGWPRLCSFGLAKVT